MIRQKPTDGKSGHPPARMGARIVLGVLTSLAFCASLFVTAGRLDWVAGWAYIGLLVCGYSLMELYIWRRNPRADSTAREGG